MLVWYVSWVLEISDFSQVFMTQPRLIKRLQATSAGKRMKQHQPVLQFQYIRTDRANLFRRNRVKFGGGLGHRGSRKAF